MSKCHLHLATALLTILAHLPSSHSNLHHYTEQCGVYLAPSTIPGAGLGMFAGRNFSNADMVTAGDILIPIVELSWHNGHETIFFLWDEYTWSHAIVKEMQDETEGNDLHAASTGIGAAINCMLPLVNVVDSDAECDNAGLHRSTDPGSGAFTPYHGRKSLATKDILQGEELFIDYGEAYFSTRQDVYGLVPFENDYSAADILLKKFKKLRDTILTKASGRLQDDLWNIVANFPIESRIMNAVPSSRLRIDELATIGTALQHKDRSRRTLEWLEEHGQCMDNIKPALSSIPQAGRGVFSSRCIPLGGLVAPAPLIHIPNRTHLIMYDAMRDLDDDGFLKRNMSSPMHIQLMINYCFGHPQSSLLLCPYGSLTSLVNHSPNPNTRITWSNTMRHPEWLQQNVTALNWQWHSGLSIDFVALRDIAKDEEITVDYGVEWQLAWEEHILGWTPGDKRYAPSYELNQQVDSVIRTMYEEPYCDSAMLWIHGEYVGLTGSKQPKVKYDFYRVLVLSRFNHDSRYTVLAFTARDMDDYTRVTWHGVIFGVPRDAFIFDDVPYSRDHQMKGAFRHFMKIPDDIMPEAWKNL
jgi:hypothetical protein